MTDLEALVVAAYVFADDYRVPARGGRPPSTPDAELVALAVAQAAIGISSDRQFLRGHCPAQGRSITAGRPRHAG